MIVQNFLFLTLILHILLTLILHLILQNLKRRFNAPLSLLE